MDKLWYVYTITSIQLLFKKTWINLKSIKWKQPDSKDNTSYDCIYMKSRKGQNHRDREYNLKTQGQGGRGARGNFSQWWKCSVSWLQRWLDDCIHLSQLKIGYILRKLYLNKAAFKKKCLEKFYKTTEKSLNISTWESLGKLQEKVSFELDLIIEPF